MALFDFVQAGHTVAASSSAAVTLTGVGAGNILVAFGLGQGGGAPSFSDGVNTWVAPFGGSPEMAYALNVAGGNTTITNTSSGASSCSVGVLEFIGDASVSFISPGSTTAYPFPGSYTDADSGNMTTTATGDLLVGAVLYNYILAASAIDPFGWTTGEQWDDTNWVVGYNMAYQIAGAPGSYNYDPNFTGVSNFASSYIIGFTSVSGGGGNPWYLYAQQRRQS